MWKAEFMTLEAWKISHEVALDVYRVTAGFPARERFGLVDQMRRAAVSMPAGVAEGYARRRPKDKAYFYTVARSSGEELKAELLVSRDLRYLDSGTFETLMSKLDHACRLTHGMVEAMEAKAAVGR